MYDKKLFCIRYIYNNITVLRVFITYFGSMECENKQTNKQTIATYLCEPKDPFNVETLTLIFSTFPCHSDSLYDTLY